MKGFTLAESLISTTIFGLIIAIIFSFLAPTNQASNKAKLESEMSNQAQLALARFTRDAQGASALEGTSAQVILKLPKYAPNGDILEGQDLITYRVLNHSLTYSRDLIADQLLMPNLQDDAVFGYLDSSLATASAENARMIRITLRAAQPYGGKLLVVQQARDIRLRNIR